MVVLVERISEKSLPASSTPSLLLTRAQSGLEKFDSEQNSSSIDNQSVGGQPLTTGTKLCIE